MREHVITISQLTAGYSQQIVLDKFNLALKAGEILSLLGASGCGKTTALKAIAGLLPAKSGEIYLGDKLVQNAHKNLPPYEREMAFIFQDYALFPHLTVAQNIAYGVRKLAKKQSQKRVDEAISMVDLTHLAKRYPHELSGGQQQRVAVARALASRPKILLMDEPFSNIDGQVKTHLIQDLRNLLVEQNIAAICVTHAKEEAFSLSDKVALMHQGRIQQIGQPQELCLQPQKRWVAEFLQTGNLWSAKHDFWPLANVPKPSVSNPDGSWFFLPHLLTLKPSSVQTNICLKAHYFSGGYYVYLLAVDNQEWTIHSYQNFNLQPDQAVSLEYQDDIFWIDD